MRSVRTPSLRRHMASSLGIVTLNGHDHYLGNWPSDRKHPPADVQTAYDRLISEWLAAGRCLQPAATEQPMGISLNELILPFWRHAEQHYRREDGTPTNELSEFRASFKPLKALYGTLPVTEFGPIKLKAVRQRMIAADWCRGVINHRIARIVRMFKWAVSEELVPESVWRSLTTVPGLERGRTTARETEPIKPVAEAHVLAVLPFTTPPVAAMLELQLLTGMRPGEARVMRACDLDTSGDVWVYRPREHKTRHRGKDRVIALGPKAQEIVRSFLRLDTQVFLFSPHEAVEQRRREWRAKRKSKVPPSQQRRKKQNPKKKPGDCYTMSSYGRAVTKAVWAANTAQACDDCKPLQPEQRCDVCKASAIPHWHPHQLRHTHATEVRRRFGLEAAQVALGHSQAKVTEVYAERDLSLATKVAQQIG